ncbi:MAG: lysophospholipid acyltransferase family protein [Nitrospinaceae bacterium]
MDRRQTIPKKMRYVLEYLLFRLILFPVQMLSLNAIGSLGRWLGNAFYHGSPKRRKIARINLDIAFGDSKTPEEKNRIIKQSMIQMTTVPLQCLWATRNTEQRVYQLFPSEPQGMEHFNNCMKRGKGAFFLMAHYGNWELLGVYMGYKNFSKVSAIARKLDNPYLENFTTKLRTISGGGVIPKEGSPLKVVRAMKKNSCVGVMMDQNGGIGGLFVDFFGKTAATPRSLALLSYSTGAAVLPLIPYPTDKGTYQPIFLPELKLEKTGDKDKDIFRWTEEYQKVLEKIIRDRPEPWMWFHRRWKSRPKGERHISIY